MNTDKKIKLIGTIVGILLFVIAIAGITYAFITWQSGNTNISGKSGCFPGVNYTNGTSLSTDNVLLFDEGVIINNNTILLKDGMAYLGVTAGISDNCNTPVQLEIKLNVTKLNNAFINGNSKGAFKYALVSYDASITDLSELKGQSLEIIQNQSITNTVGLYLRDIPLATDTNGYLIIFYIDGDMASNDAANSEFTVSINGKVVQVTE